MLLATRLGVSTRPSRVGSSSMSSSCRRTRSRSSAACSLVNSVSIPRTFVLDIAPFHQSLTLARRSHYASRPTKKKLNPRAGTMLLVGLTGNIGAGKSTVAQVFVRKGATLIDADVLARDAVAPGTPGLAAVLARWGDRVRAADGSLDRAKLRAIVFTSDAEREALNAIVHPIVEELRIAQVEDARRRGDRIVVCDIPLLYEKDMASRFDCV